MVSGARDPSSFVERTRPSKGSWGCGSLELLFGAWKGEMGRARKGEGDVVLLCFVSYVVHDASERCVVTLHRCGEAEGWKAEPRHWRTKELELLERAAMPRLWY